MGRRMSGARRCAARAPFERSISIVIETPIPAPDRTWLARWCPAMAHRAACLFPVPSCHLFLSRSLARSLSQIASLVVLWSSDIRRLPPTAPTSASSSRRPRTSTCTPTPALRSVLAALPLKPVHLGGRAPRVQLSAGMLASSGSAGSSHTRCTVLLLGTSPPASLDLIIEKIGGRVPSPRGRRPASPSSRSRLGPVAPSDACDPSRPV